MTGIFVDIQRGISKEIPNLIGKVEKWHWLSVSMQHLVEESEKIAVYAYGNASNFKLEVPRYF